MIEVEHLTKEFGPIKAVQDISFSVAQGEILGFLGPNGAGKTTTMRILAGVFPPTSGTAKIAGFDLGKNPMEIRKRIGYLPEQIPLYPELTVSEYLDFVASVWNYDKPEKQKRLNKVCDQCGLSEVKGALTGRLSRGYRQRVGLAQALIHDPQVLILDEPTVGLDPAQIREIRTLIKSFQGKKTVLLSTHILPEVAMTCQKVVIIHQGKAVAQGTPDSLTAAYAKGAQIEVEAEGPPDEILKTLRSIPGAAGVERISQNGDSSRFLVTGDLSSNHKTDLRPDIARTLVGKNWPLFELSSKSPTLEDIFMRLITREENQ